MTVFNHYWLSWTVDISWSCTHLFTKGINSSLLIASKHAEEICLLQWWSIPSQTTCLALGVLNPKRWEIFENFGSHNNFQRRLGLFSSMWPSPGNNTKLLNFDTKCPLMSILFLSLLKTIWNLCRQYFSYQSWYHILNTSKHCPVYVANTYGTPSDINVVHFRFPSFPTVETFWVWDMTVCTASCEHSFTMQGSPTCI